MFDFPRCSLKALRIIVSKFNNSHITPLLKDILNIISDMYKIKCTNFIIKTQIIGYQHIIAVLVPTTMTI